jgi:hypothetical protein
VSVVSISSLSTQYVKVPIRIRESGSAVDPTASTVTFAYTANATTEPGASDWVTGSWETAGSTYYARVLTGPDGDADPGDGTWTLWVKVVRDPETIVLPAGTVVIT